MSLHYLNVKWLGRPYYCCGLFAISLGRRRVMFSLWYRGWLKVRVYES